MANIVIFNEKGLVTHLVPSAHTPDFVDRDDVLINPEIPNCEKHCMIVEDSQVRQMTDEEMTMHRTLPASMRRARAYPSVPDQLDMMFHDMTEGKAPMSPTWYAAIKEVKDAIEKDL